MSAASAQSADIGEALATARRIRKLDGASWFLEWARTADEAGRVGEEAKRSGDLVTALQAFLRASEYHRQSYYFIRSNLDDVRLQKAHRNHVEMFLAAAELMARSAIPVHIPYSGTALGGYFFAPNDSRVPRPTLVFPCGYDSTAESGWANVPAGLERGYNVLLFDGPGQGEALYGQRLYLRPDFEAVVSPVLDWLLARSDVDPAGVVLIGRSFAGYLAPRAAAFEPRLAALVCDPPQPNMGARLPRGVAGRLAVPAIEAQVRMNKDRAEFFGARMAAHGVTSIAAYFSALRSFNMLPCAAGIACPTLLVEAEHDFAAGGSAVLRDAMIAPVDLQRLSSASGAGGHCAGLGQEIWNAAVYGWLNRVLSKR